jgi:hypothetical protein
MRLAAGILVAASGCYAPNVESGAPCDLALNNCPRGQSCKMTPSGPFCSGNATINDAAMGDGKIPDSAPGCLGTGLVTNICLMPPPTTDVMITTNRTINTAMVGGGNCDQIIAQQLGGASMCMIVGKTITIATGIRLTAQGPNPLLLVAKETFDVMGTIDVASHIAATNPGAGSEATCSSNAGGMGSGNDGGGGGGGGGGSFGTAGAAGGNGNGTGGQAGPGGQAIPAMTPGNLRGGCRGGSGGAGSGGGFGGPGLGGAGGGGVYMIAGTSITVGGSINASGAPGAGGLDSTNAGSGGGGGGSGGMIALDAPTVMVSGSLFANGGGGGGGCGNDPSRVGSPGSEPTSATVQANGGNGGQGNGGNGGRGYALNMIASQGNNGGSQYSAGGGGGGGAGVIKIFGGTMPSALGGTISPPATQ